MGYLDDYLKRRKEDKNTTTKPNEVGNGFGTDSAREEKFASKQRKNAEPTSYLDGYIKRRHEKQVPGALDALHSRIDTYQKDVSSLYDAHNSRYAPKENTANPNLTVGSGWRGDYEDWYTGTSERYDALSAERNSILEELDKYRDYIDPAYMDDIQTYLTSTASGVRNVYDTASGERDRFSQFTDENDYMSALAAEEERKAEIDRLLSLDIGAANAKVDELEALISASRDTANRYETAGDAIDDNELAYEEYVQAQDYDIEMRDYLSQQNALKKDIESAGWLQLTQRPDFAELSKYDSSIDAPDWYRYVNEGDEAFSYGEGIGYAEQGLDYLTEEEKQIFNYVFRTEGKAGVDRYYEYLKNDLAKRRANDKNFRRAEELANANPIKQIAASLASVPESIAGNLGATIIDTGALLLGEEVNPYSPYHDVRLDADAIRGQVSENIANATSFLGAKPEDNILSNLYQGVMSLADFAAAAPLAKVNSALAPFVSAFTQVTAYSAASQSTMKDIYDRGGSQFQMAIGGVLSGVTEALAEKLPIENMLNQMSPTATRAFVTNLLVQGGIEATEETVTDIVNEINDRWLMGEKSRFETSVRDYMANGYSRSEAEAMAFNDFAGDLLMTAATSFLTGSLSGAASTAPTAISDTIEGRKIKKSDGGADQLYKLAEEMAMDEFATEEGVADINRLMDKAKAKKKPSSIALGRLNRAVQNESLRQIHKAYDTTASEEVEQTATTTPTETAPETATETTSRNRAIESYRVFDTDGNEVEAEEGMFADLVDSEGNSIDSTTAVMRQAGAEYNASVAPEYRIYDADGYSVDPSAVSYAPGEYYSEGGDVIADPVALANEGREVSGLEASEVSAPEAVEASDVGATEASYESVVAEMSPDTVNRIKDMFDSFGESAKLDAREYRTLANEAYYLGYNGLDADLMFASFDGVTLPEGQAREIYNLGRMARIEADAKARASAPAVTQTPARKATTAPAKTTTKTTTTKKTPNTASQRGKDRKLIIESGIAVNRHGSIKEESLTPMQRANLIAFRALAELSPIKFHVFASKKVNGKFVAEINGVVREDAPNGMYITGQNDIWVDLNAGGRGQGVSLYAAAHEISHYIKDRASEKWSAMADYLMEEMRKNPDVDVDEMLEHQREKLRAREDLANLTEEELEELAVEEFVSDALSDMLTDGTVVNFLAELKQKDKTLWETIKDAILNLLKRWGEVLGMYEGLAPDAPEARALAGMKEAYNNLQQMYAEAFAEANEVEVARQAGDVSNLDVTPNTDVVPVESTVKHSFRSLAQAAGFEAVELEDGTKVFMRDGNRVKEVTVEDIDNSPIGALINFSLDKGDIDAAHAQRQKEMFARVCTMAVNTNDFSMAMTFMGSAVFTGMKANSDKQYGTTYDFPSICTKTQAVIDAMSEKMKKLQRGLTSDELKKVYNDVFASGNPVPCPECYVFSRWIGIGGLLDNIWSYQTLYGEMGAERAAAEYRKMYNQVEQYAKDNNLTTGKAKGALASKITKEYNKLKETIEKKDNQGETVAEGDRQRLASLEETMTTVKAMTWLEKVYFKGNPLTETKPKVNPGYAVPSDILFDLNMGEVFATRYKDAWAFRTTQGAGYGKAITPYAEAVIGEGILVTNNTSKTIKDKQAGKLNNIFIDQKGHLNKDAKKALERARLKQKIQAFLGGQRFQSTSDARFENASDYLIAMLEMQAMGGMVQAYTKVDGAVPAFNAWGASTNQSLMPKNGGVDKDGNIIDTNTGGMNRNKAFENRKKYEQAGTITIGVNDIHIRAMFGKVERDFIIPYHASGGSAELISEFRRIQEDSDKEVFVRSTDYTRVQSEKELSDDVLTWLGKSPKEIARIKDRRTARVAILTGGTPDMEVVRSSKYLSALYEKFAKGGEWEGVKLPKGKIATTIFPNEYWDKSVTYEESAKITRDYLAYCDELGFLHKFSGTVPSNGVLKGVNGYDPEGNRVPLTDLAYKYDEDGNITSEVEPFFWKVLTDRRMYGNDGRYLEQKVITLNDTTEDTVTNFAKNNTGRQYDKELSKRTATAIAEGRPVLPSRIPEKLSERNTEYTSRSLLEALEETVQTSEELNRLAEYRKNLDAVEGYEARLAEVREEIKEMSFSKGKRDSEWKKRYTVLRLEANDLTTKVDNHTRKLLRLESTKELKRLFDSEKNKAARRTADKYRERISKTRENQKKKSLLEGIRKNFKEIGTMLRQNSKEKHVPEGLKKSIAALVSAFDNIEGIYDSNVEKINVATAALEKINTELARAVANEAEPSTVADLQKKRDAIVKRIENLTAQNNGLKEASNEYKKILNSEDPEEQSYYDELIAGLVSDFAEAYGDKRISDLTVEELEDISRLAKMMNASVKNFNKAHIKARGETISGIVGNVAEEIVATGKKLPMESKGGKAIREYFWNNEKPVYAFERVGSKEFMNIYNSFLGAEGKFAKVVAQEQKNHAELQEKTGAKAWNFGERVDIKLESGETASVTLGQLMYVYALKKRGDGQGMAHLTGKGYVDDSAIEVQKEKVTKSGKKKKSIRKYTVNENLAKRLTEGDVAHMETLLTKEQIEYANGLIASLARVAELGNQISMLLYGVKLYTVEDYFPLISSKDYLYQKNEVPPDRVVKNYGWTHSVRKGANNPVVLFDIRDVWANHIYEMAMYYAFSIPLDTFGKVYNGKYVDKNGNVLPVSSLIRNAYGEAADKYFKTLIEDLNGGARSDRREGVLNKLISAHKKQSVFMSLSVMFQQPSAIIRSTALVDPKYFVGKKYNPDDVKGWEQLKKYAPIAILKEMGHFDMGTGKSTSEILKNEKGLRDKVNDFATKGAELSDKVSWLILWDAVKRETVAKHPALSPSSSELLTLAGERFTEVVAKTQVYDSTLSRSANMRSKSAGMQMVTSFMGEPTVAANMFGYAVRELKKGNKGIGIRFIASIYTSILFNNVLKAIAVALRDDDEDETFGEKYLSALVDGIINDSNPLTYMPYLRDVMSIVKGYDVERADMSLVDDAIKTINKFSKVVSTDTSGMTEEELKKHNANISDLITDVLTDVGYMLDIPVKNATRELMAIWNTVDKQIIHPQKGKGLSAAIVETLEKSVPFGIENWWKDKDKSTAKKVRMALEEFATDPESAYDMLDSAVETIVARKYESIEKKGLTPSRDFDEDARDEAMSDIRSALGDMYKEGGISAEDTEEILMNYFGETENEAYWTFDRWDYDASNTSTAPYSKYRPLMEALSVDGDTFKAELQRYLDHPVSKGDTAKKIDKANRDAIADAIRDYYKEIYLSLEGHPKAQTDLKVKLLDAYVALGFDRSDRRDAINKWGDED